MTTANKITILRILLIPFFVVELIYYVQTGNEIHRLLAHPVVCGHGDSGRRGRLHRPALQPEERTGRDPRSAGGQAAARVGHRHVELQPRPYLGQIPLWLTGTIIGRDLLLLIGIVVIRLTVGKVIVRPRLTGKIATVLQMVVVIWILLDWDRDLNARWLKVWTIGAAAFTGVSGLLYVWDGVRQLGSHPASSAEIENHGLTRRNTDKNSFLICVYLCLICG